MHCPLCWCASLRLFWNCKPHDQVVHWQVSLTTVTAIPGEACFSNSTNRLLSSSSSLNQAIGNCVEMDTQADSEASNNNLPPNQDDELEDRPLKSDIDFPSPFEEWTVAWGPVKWSIETHASLADLHFSFAQIQLEMQWLRLPVVSAGESTQGRVNPFPKPIENAVLNSEQPHRFGLAFSPSTWKCV